METAVGISIHFCLTNLFPARYILWIRGLHKLLTAKASKVLPCVIKIILITKNNNRNIAKFKNKPLIIRV